MLKVWPFLTMDNFYEIQFPSLVKINHKNLLCRLRQLFLFISNIAGHLQLGSVLRNNCFKAMAHHHLRIQYKYLGEYLVCGFSAKQKLVSLTESYRYLMPLVSKKNALNGIQSGIVLWSQPYNNDEFSITLEIPELTYREGEWVLAFNANKTTIFTMSFTLLPAEIVEKGNPELAVLIGGVQGTAGCSDWIKLAAKANGDIFPSILLFTALQALALSWRVNTIFAVTAAKQISPVVRENAERYLNTYDKFWESQGGVLVNDFYKFSPLPAEKPASDLSGTHSARSKRKRALRKQLLESISAYCERLFAVG